VLAKTSVEAESKEARSVRRQGERSGMKHLLLCAVLKGYWMEEMFRTGSEKCLKWSYRRHSNFNWKF